MLKYTVKHGILTDCLLQQIGQSLSDLLHYPIFYAEIKEIEEQKELFINHNEIEDGFG